MAGYREVNGSIPIPRGVYDHTGCMDSGPAHPLTGKASPISLVAGMTRTSLRVRRRTIPRGNEPLGDMATEVLFENERVKIWRLIVEPGQASAWHLHPRDYVTVTVEPADMKLETEDGTTQAIPPVVGRWQYHGEHTVHRVVNDSDNRHQNLLIELMG